MRYFAYGSNLLVCRMRLRVPSAELVSTATLGGYTLRFHKRGRDGSAKCNAVATGRAEDVVHGVVYSLEPADRARLDEAERGYATRTVAVSADGREIEAFLYVALPDFVDESLRPFDWYRDLVVAGAREHGFPEGVVAAFEGVETIVDRDAARRAQARRLLRST